MLAEHFGSGRQQTCLDQLPGSLHCRARHAPLTLFDCVTCSPPAKSQNPSSPLHPTTDKLGFSGCLEQSVVTPNSVVGQSTGVHNQSNDDLFRQKEKCMCFHGNQEPRAAPYKIPFTLSARPLTSFVHFVAKRD